MGKLGYTRTLLRELAGMAREYRAYWLVPLALILLLVGLLVFTTEATAPLLYTLF